LRGTGGPAVGLRALLAVVFVIAVLLLPKPTLGALVLMFAAYMSADGALAIVSELRAMRRDLTPIVHPAMAGVLWLELRICADGATDDRRSWSGLRRRSSVAVKVAA
jgi:uncharacterized membrane protein HdeD (DUF308 family)